MSIWSGIKTFFMAQQGISSETNTKERIMKATIVETTEGRFGLALPGSGVIGTYARRRDAVRGATRRGLAVA